MTTYSSIRFLRRLFFVALKIVTPKASKRLPVIGLIALLCFSTAHAQNDNIKNQRALLPPIISFLLFEDSSPGNMMTVEDASRFLIQTTFGPTYDDIVDLSNSSFQTWLNRQYGLPVTKTVTYAESQNWVENHPLIISRATDSSLLNVMIGAPDQLRQRVAYALSQIFVVSRQVSNGIDERPLFYLDYYDLLAEGAFGNYRDLLEKVTLNDVMGFYLTMKLNAPANTQVGPVNHASAFFVTSPDENYAREVMQLFSIGLIELNIDGTPKLVNGQQVPSYTQETVQSFARVFTGWNFQSANGTNFFNLGIPNDTSPMISFDSFHDKAPKTLLSDITLPANQTAVKDLDMALDNIFNHPNVGPFIGKLLIQHLVTSNPTPAYVERVARVFNNNGNGVRGDLKAVINTILLDTEARNGHKTIPNQFGKFKEPFIRQLSLWRALKTRRKVSNRNLFGSYDDGFLDRFKQAPLWAPSVFNFYQQDFSAPGVLRENEMLSPVAQLMDTESVIGIASVYEEYVQRHHDNARNSFANSTETFLLNTQEWQALVSDDLTSIDDLIERLNIVFLAGAMTDDMRDVLRSVHSATNSNSPYLSEHKWQIVIDLLNILMVSPQFSVQK